MEERGHRGGEAVKMGTFQFHASVIANLFVLTITTTTLSMNTEIVDRQLPSTQLAVTSSSDIEDLYVRVRNRFSSTYVDSAEVRGPLRGEDYLGTFLGLIAYEMYPMEHPFVREIPVAVERRDELADKNRICARIFGSAFFEMYDEEVVNFDPETEEPKDLLLYDRTAYHDIYGEEGATKRQWLNPYRQRDVSVRGATFRENFFRCVTRKRRGSATGSPYKTYLISPIYRSWYPEGSTMVGRFVFADDLKVFAAAEEPAVVRDHVIGLTLRAYFDVYEARSGSASANVEGNEEEDRMSNVVCRLSMADKIRFCAVVLNAIEQPERITFQPLEENVEAGCQKKKIFALAQGVERRPERPWYTYAKFEPVKEDVQITYREWTIGCKGRPAHSDGEGRPSLSTYYVSRGADLYTAIIYRPVGDEIYSPHLGLDCVHLVQGTAVTKYISVTLAN